MFSSSHKNPRLTRRFIMISRFPMRAGGLTIGVLLAMLVVVAFGMIAQRSHARSPSTVQGRGWTASRHSSSANRTQDLPANASLTAAGAKTLRFDVAENGLKFTFDETPLFPDGLPAFGDEFITEGYIYPVGTINGSNGVNPDGSPEFPDQVIGKWSCRGWHVGDGAHTVTGPWVATTQIYDLSSQPGSETIVSDGFELADIDVPIIRAITGGTGPWAQARGEVMQTLLGFNQLNGVNIRYEVSVVKK
jgi:hypothetical protein